MPALSGNFNFATDYFLQQSVAVLSHPSQHFVSSQQALSHSAFLSHSAHFSSVHFSLQHSSLQHLSSQHSVFSPQQASVHSAFLLLLQHEHEAAAIIAATITIDIKTFFIVNQIIKGLNKTLSHKNTKGREKMQIFCLQSNTFYLPICQVQRPP